jgi:hypothetical protein
MSIRSAADAVTVEEVPKAGTGLLLAVAAAIVCPFDCVLAGMIRAGLSIEAICAYLGLSRAVLDYNIIRLDLVTPHDRPRRRGGRRPWTDSERRWAIYWRCLGVHPESIGLALDRSATAVRSQMHRLGVPAPDRKKLHKVDPATLDRTPPDFGFPVPPDERVPATTTRSGDQPHTSLAIVSTASEAAPAADETTPIKKGARKGRNAAVPGQCDLTLLRVTPPTRDDSKDVSEVPGVDPPHEKAALSTPVCEPAEVENNEKPEVVGPPDLVRQYQVVGKVRRQDTNEAFLRWLTLLYLGGMHFKAMSSYLGRSPSAVQAILYRMQIPRDKTAGKFGRTCDLEAAVANLETWGFALIRCTADQGLSEHDRPLFWRHKDDKSTRKRRCSRLKNNEIDDWFKYKGGNTYSILTREELEKQGRLKSTSSGVQQPARLQAAMQGSLPIQQGATNEQFPSRDRPQAVGPRLPGHAREPMPWTYPRNGGATRPVAHP